MRLDESISDCQHGAVHTWHKAAVQLDCTPQGGQLGHDLLDSLRGELLLEIDAGVRAILDAAFDRALESLRKNRAVPDACAAALLAKLVVGVYRFPFSRPTPVNVAMLVRGYVCST